MVKESSNVHHLALPTGPFKEMTNDPEGMSLTVRSNPGKAQPTSPHGHRSLTGQGAAKSPGHASSNSMDICQQRSSPVQCLERDVRARSPSMSLAFHGVPEDVYVHFLQYMTVQHLSKLSQVSRQLRRQCQCNTMWKNLCLDDFGEDAPIIVEQYTDAFAQVHEPAAPGFYQHVYRKMLDFRIEICFLQGPRANDDACKIAKSQETNIGRSRANDICILQDEMVSRKHGKIIPRPRCYMLEDLGSINGTFINQKQVDSNTTVPLRLGDEVEMGNSVFKIMLAVPNAMEEDEATTAVDEADLAALQKDQEMADGNAAPGEEALDGHEEVYDNEEIDDDDEEDEEDEEDEVEDHDMEA